MLPDGRESAKESHQYVPELYNLVFRYEDHRTQCSQSPFSLISKMEDIVPICQLITYNILHENVRLAISSNVFRSATI